MEQRLSALTLHVADVEKSLVFYRTLGWTPAFAKDEVAFIQLNGVVLCLFPGLAEDAGIEATGSGARFAIAHNVRTPEAVEATLEMAQAAGATITRPAHQADWGGRSGYFSDPDGHLWEVAHNPFWNLSDDGSVTIPE
jgi:catechol 2,3-dioxygenase-like lactoylglutathione lyase family enzyme